MKIPQLQLPSILVRFVGEGSKGKVEKLSKEERAKHPEFQSASHGQVFVTATGKVMMCLTTDPKVLYGAGEKKSGNLH